MNIGDLEETERAGRLAVSRESDRKNIERQDEQRRQMAEIRREAFAPSISGVDGMRIGDLCPLHRSDLIAEAEGKQYPVVAIAAVGIRDLRLGETVVAGCAIVLDLATGRLKLAEALPGFTGLSVAK